MDMRETGTLVDWKDEKGFGFIKPDSGGRDIFVHIRAIRNVSRRPQVGDRIEFEPGSGKDGRPRAEGALLLITAPVDPFPYIAMLFCLGVACVAMMRTGYPFPLAYLAMGGVTYILYSQDKQRAQDGEFRIPENTLHFTELLGGWCAGYLAQQRLRHKTIKTSYQFVFWMIASLHIAGWGYYLWTVIQTVKK